MSALTAMPKTEAVPRIKRKTVEPIKLAKDNFSLLARLLKYPKKYVITVPDPIHNARKTPVFPIGTSNL